VNRPGAGSDGVSDPVPERPDSSQADTAARWRQTQELFHRAANLPASERIQKLSEWCGADAALRESVLGLLEADGCVEELISAAPSSGCNDLLLRRPDSESSGSGEDLDSEDDGEEDAWVGRVLGAFRLQRLLGRGGMGVVYLGERISGGFTQRVAVKLIGRHLRSSPAVAQFLLERETLAKLEHAHIARLLDGGVTGEGFPYVVMEYVEGRRLDVACDDPSTTVAQMIRWMLQLCDAVTYVHRNLILHRDLKPGNVMVADDGSVKLLDFGTLKQIGPGTDTDSEMTQAGMRPVTVRYASPEHIQGIGVSTSADVYSLGMILYRLIAGRLPEGLDDLPIGLYLERLREGRFKAPSQLAADSTGHRAIEPHLARDLDAIVAKALRYEPEARYPTVNALAQDFWNVLLHRPVTAHADSFRYRAAKFYRRNRWPIRAAAAALFVVALGLSVMAWQGHLARLEELRAEAGVEDERQLAHMLIFDYFEQLNLIPGSIEAQKKAVTQALSYLDSVAQIAPGSSLELDTIKGYTDMGNLLGNPYQQNLGNVPDAIRSLNKALALAQVRVERNRLDRESLHSLVSAEDALGGTYLGNGDAVHAEQNLKAAAETVAQIVSDPRTDGELLELAATVTDTLGDVYDPGRGYVTADRDKSMQSYLKSNEYDGRCHAVDAKNIVCWSSVVVGEYKIGSLFEGPDPALAANHYRHGLEVVLSFPPDLMKTTRSHRLKNYMLSRLGLMEIRTGHMADGMAHSNQAQADLREAIAKAELDNRARFDLVAMGTDLAIAYDEYGKEAEAEEVVKQVLEALSVLLQRSPANTRWQMIQAEDQMTYARVEKKLGRKAVADEASRIGVAQATRIAQDKDASPEALGIAADGLLEFHLHPEDAEVALGFAQRAVHAYAKPTPDLLLTLAKAQAAAGDRREAAKSAQLVLAGLAGPVKSKTVADEIAEARKLAIIVQPPRK
jgi:serine/threonine protein kinase